MPEFYGKILAVRYSELVPLCYPSEGALRKAISDYKDKPYGIKKCRVGGHGREALVDFDSLPIEMQNVLGDLRKHEHILERYYTIDGEAVEFYSEYQLPDSTYLKPVTQERYVINASVLKALKQLKIDREHERISKGGSTRYVMASIHDDALSFNDLLRAKHSVRHDLPKNIRRFREKWNEFDANGYVALIKDAQGSRKLNAKKVTDATIKLLNDLFSTQSHKPTATQVAMQYQAFIDGELEIISTTTGECYQPSKYAPLSERTITSYLKQWENRIGTYAKRGNKKLDYVTEFKIPHKLSHPKYSGALISIDDRNPPFKYAHGSAKRVWFYMALDVASDAFICWVHGKTKEGVIVEFYRQLVRNLHEWGLNMPYELECEMALNSTYKDTLLRNGNMFENVRIEANNPWGKIIETRFKPLRYGIEKQREGWLARPFAKSESNAGSDAAEKIVPYDEITNNALTDIVTWNNMEHRTAKGKSRWEYFLENQHPDLKPINYKGILPFVGHKQTSSVHRGQLNFRNTLYLLGNESGIATGDDLIDLMRKVEDATVDIYWLDGNQGQVIKAMIFDTDMRYICSIYEKPAYNRSTLERNDDDEAARTLMSRYEATIRHFGKAQTQEIEPVVVVDHRPKVISNTFMIPGLEPYQEPSEEPVEVLDDYEEDDNYKEDTSTVDWRNKFKI